MVLNNLSSFYCYSIVEQNTISNPVLTACSVLAVVCIGGFLFFYIFRNVSQERILMVLYRNSYAQYLISKYRTEGIPSPDEKSFYSQLSQLAETPLTDQITSIQSALDKVSLSHDKAFAPITVQQRTVDLIAEKLRYAKAVTNQAVAQTNAVKELPEISEKMTQEGMQKIISEIIKTQLAVDESRATEYLMTRDQRHSINWALDQVNTAHVAFAKSMNTQEHAAKAAVKGAEAGEALVEQLRPLKTALEQAEAIGQSITAQEQVCDPVTTQEAYHVLADQLGPVFAAFDKLADDNAGIGREVIKNLSSYFDAALKIPSELKEIDQVSDNLTETVRIVMEKAAILRMDPEALLARAYPPKEPAARALTEEPETALAAADQVEAAQTSASQLTAEQAAASKEVANQALAKLSEIISSVM